MTRFLHFVYCNSRHIMTVWYWEGNIIRQTHYWRAIFHIFPNIMLSENIIGSYLKFFHQRYCRDIQLQLFGYFIFLLLSLFGVLLLHQSYFSSHPAPGAHNAVVDICFARSAKRLQAHSYTKERNIQCHHCCRHDVQCSWRHIIVISALVFPQQVSSHLR